MALDDEWVADVRRWYFDERPHVDGTPSQGVASELADAGEAIGYEAAWQPSAADDAATPLSAPHRDPG